MKFVEKWVELENILNEATKPIKTRTVRYFSYVKPTMELSLIYIYILWYSCKCRYQCPWKHSELEEYIRHPPYSHWDRVSHQTWSPPLWLGRWSTKSSDLLTSAASLHSAPSPRSGYMWGSLAFVVFLFMLRSELRSSCLCSKHLPTEPLLHPWLMCVQACACVCVGCL